LTRRLVHEYPDSFFGRIVQGQSRQRERIGEPFDLEFTDAISGDRISMKSFRGKIVVVDFWATWCGPCVGEIPEMKRLYADYHDHPLTQHSLPGHWQFWERHARWHLERCDEVVVLMLDGWDESEGVQAEIQIATELEKVVWYRYTEGGDPCAGS
jgi:thiol-disulfide isomerase/thioredoxin